MSWNESALKGCFVYLMYIYEINNSKCPGDLEVCCKTTKSEQPTKDDTTTSTPTGSILEFPANENFTSRCGRHNKQGIDIRIVESVEGSETTQVGEWPHTCILFYRFEIWQSHSFRQALQNWTNGIVKKVTFEQLLCQILFLKFCTAWLS